MEKKINLEEILWESFHNNGIPKPTHTLTKITQKAVKEAMKETCRQVLELAAENAKTREMTEFWSGQVWDDGPLPICVDKQSILDTINQVE